MAKKKSSRGRPKGTARKTTKAATKKARRKAAAGRRRGTAPPKEEAPAEPARLTSAPDPPADLDGEALELWRRLARQLTSLGALSELDLPALRLLCEAWQHYLSLDQYADPDQMFFETRTGYIAEHPGVRMRAAALTKVLQLAKAFGLTPAARGGVDLALDPPAADGLEKFGDQRPE